MARQQGIIRYSGRLGNSVGYLARDGKGRTFDASRILAEKVTNPQTIAQMDQRMKMAPIINFFRGLQGILDHSWQGVKYGQPSRLFFYSQTLRALSSAGVPYLIKGDKQFVPWQFPISQGSIPVVMQPEITDENDGGMKIPMPESFDTITTLGDLSEALINNYMGLRNGMQLTFIWVYMSGNIFIPQYKRLTLDTTSDTSITELEIAISAVSEYITVINRNSGGTEIETPIAAAGIIVSALVNNTWERNTATMVITNTLRALYNSQSAYDAMLASYRTTANSIESDYYLNGGGEEEGSSTVATVKEVTLDTSTGEKTIAYYKVGGTKYAPYYTATVEQQSMAYGYRKGSDVAFTKTAAQVLGSAFYIEDLQTEYLAFGYTLCTRAELLAIAPELTIPE